MTGQIVSYSFVVSSPGNVTLTGIAVIDAKCNAAPTYVSGDGNTDGKLQLSESWTYTCSHTVTQAEVDAGGVLTNQVSADSDQTSPTSDSLDIPIANTPALSVVKSSTTTVVTSANQVVTYSFAISNLGNVTLTNITITDARCDTAPTYVSGDSDSDSQLQLSEIWTYTCSHTVTQAEIDAGGNLTNTVLADSDQTQPTSDTLDIPINQNPALKVVKTSTTIAIHQANEVVPYSFVISNEGNLTLTGITVSDAKCDATPTYVSGDSNNDSLLQIAESWLYTCLHTVTQAEIEAGGTLTNTVTADSDQTKPVQDLLNIAIVQNPVLVVVKLSTTTQITTAEQVVPYRFAVSNPGNVTLTGVTVTDAKCNAAPVYLSGDSNNDNKLQITESWVYSCSHTVTQAEMDAGGSLVNTVTADTDQTQPVQDMLNIPVLQNPALSVAKSSTTNIVTTSDQIVPYQFTVKNLGNVVLTGITVTDARCDAAPTYVSGDSNNDSKLQTSETWLYACSHTVTQAEIDAGDNLVNTVRADSDQTQPVQDILNIPIDQNPVISINKASTTAQVTKVDQVVPYTLTIDNNGNMTLTGITVTDTKCDSAPLYVSGDSNNDSKLQTNESWIYTCSHTVTQAEIDAGGNLLNLATATSNETQPVQDLLNIPVDQNPLISITKSTVITQVTSGDPITFTIVVVNVGNVTLTDVTVTDPAAPDCSKFIGTLTVGESTSYTCSMKVTESKDFTNVATATAKPPTGPNVSDVGSAVVKVISGTPAADPITDEPSLTNRRIFLPLVTR